jgi:hypothetical protein
VADAWVKLARENAAAAEARKAEESLKHVVSSNDF